MIYGNDLTLKFFGLERHPFSFEVMSTNDYFGFGKLQSKYFAAWTSQWTIPLKEAASLLWYFYRDPLRSLTFLSLYVLSQKS